jgi:NADPH:quinone reductase-like Zn-dependent oxidoreductase
MQAVMVRATGGPEVLQLEEVERPEPADGQVLVEVRAVGVNPIEWKQRSGISAKELPAVLGSDISGVVATSRAEQFAPGDEVFGFAATGGYAQFAASPAAVLARKPEGLSHEQAAALPVASLTAWQALFDRGGLARGQRALIAGAAGGVGHLAVQFAARAGAHTIGTASGRNRDFVLGLGAAEFIDYTRQDVAEVVSDVDVAFDTVGGETTERLLATLRPGGVLVTIAAAAPEQAAADRGVRADLLIMSPNVEELARIGGAVAAGEITVDIADTLPLAEVGRAHELSESRHTRGKIVLRP